MPLQGPGINIAGWRDRSGFVRRARAMISDRKRKFSEEPGNVREPGPLVSIILIFLNGERFIRQAIDSVFCQTYQNWELLLCDDGSTDSSSQIACELAQLHPGRVRYLEHESHQNRGMSAARNLGIRHAQGEFIALL